VLTAAVAADILGGPTHVDRAHSGTRDGNSNCERALNEDSSNSVILGRAEPQALIRGLANPRIHSVKDFIEEAHKTLESSCATTETATGPGANVLSYPTELSGDAILCVLNAETNTESSELIWSHSGIYYTLIINLDEDENVSVEPDRAIAALREMSLLPAE
jgi:hypothetical protein